MIQPFKYLCRDDRQGQRWLRWAFNLSSNGFELWSYETAFQCDPRLFISHSALHYFSLLRTLNSDLAAFQCSCTLSLWSLVAPAVSYECVFMCLSQMWLSVDALSDRMWRRVQKNECFQMYLSPETVHCTPAAEFPSSWFAWVLSALIKFKALLSFDLLQLYSQPPAPGPAHLTLQCSPRATSPDQISYFLAILLLNSPLSPLTDPTKTVAFVFQPLWA